MLAVTEKAVTAYEESESHEERQLRTLIVGLAAFYDVGGTHDPFDVLPQFRNPHLDALYLSRNCKFESSVSIAAPDASRHARIRV